MKPKDLFEKEKDGLRTLYPEDDAEDILDVMIQVSQYIE